MASNPKPLRRSWARSKKLMRRFMRPICQIPKEELRGMMACGSMGSIRGFTFYPRSYE